MEPFPHTPSATWLVVHAVSGSTGSESVLCDLPAVGLRVIARANQRTPWRYASKTMQALGPLNISRENPKLSGSPDLN